LQKIYNKYKERFIEINGKNRCLYTRRMTKNYSIDIGNIYSHLDPEDVWDFVWRRTQNLVITNKKIATKLANKEIETPVDILDKQITDFRYLEREVREIYNETGRYDLFLAVGFVIGCIGKDTVVKAPLLFVPVTIEISKNEITIQNQSDLPISLNKSFIYAFCNANYIPASEIVQDFYPQENNSYKNIEDIISILNEHNFAIRMIRRKNFILFDETKEIEKTFLEYKNMLVLGRFSTTNPIYDDYLVMEKENYTTPNLQSLLQGKELKTKKEKEIEPVFSVNDIDFAQEKAIENIAKNNNLVIIGPPGTGKSQTIVNIISDAIAKGKRILVVSQKKVALDVVYSRLGKLNNKAICLSNPEKDKVAFYEKINKLHQITLNCHDNNSQNDYQVLQNSINDELAILEKINQTLYSPTDFGLSLQEMYDDNFVYSKNSEDQNIYNAFKQSDIINYDYNTLFGYMKQIRDRKIDNLFSTHKEIVDNNSMARHIRPDIASSKIKEICVFLESLIAEENPPFDFTKFKHSRYLATFFLEKVNCQRPKLEKLADIIMSLEYPSLYRLRNISFIPPICVILPFILPSYSNKKNDILIDLNLAMQAFNGYQAKYSMLQSFLTEVGFAQVLGSIIHGNYQLLKQMLNALQNYKYISDLNSEISEIPQEIMYILKFCNYHSQNTTHDFQYLINMIVPMRVHYEITILDGYYRNELIKMVSFDKIRQNILALKSEQRKISQNLAESTFSEKYNKTITDNPELSKDYAFQIAKKKDLWSIRKMIDTFREYLLDLFPCWLLPPQIVSMIMPLEKDLFDFVIFDEASQLFVENAIPSIYRGKKIVVAGDNNQLPPSSTFIKRYLATDDDGYYDLPTQTALEVTSLLDLASAKFPKVELTYHYRSKYSELIDFSNSYFYHKNLQIAPNLNIDSHPPIERIKIKGVWIDRKNIKEATEVVKLVKKLLYERTDNETIGIVTFNNDQKECIENLFDKECDKNRTFAKQYYDECNRIEKGENHSLFVKNLENVQGDERDIIIFSIGYAKNARNKVNTQFGSLSKEGGENRLNVAITRAKKKIYVITSIEPEELENIEEYKNSGGKLLKRYLQYVRAVSNGEQDEIIKLLNDNITVDKTPNIGSCYERELKKGLEKRGYNVLTNLGNTDYKLALGIFDKLNKKFLLGIESDRMAFDHSEDIMERDIYRIKFLEDKGWKVVRIWSRDWWQSPSTVLDRIEKIINE